MLGLVDEARHITTQWFKNEGDRILLLGLTRADLGASELLYLLTGEVYGAVPDLDLDLEVAVQTACLEAIRSGLVKSAHDCSEGGLAFALAECSFSSYGRPAIGARIDLTEHSLLSGILDPATLLFAESPSRILLSVRPGDVQAVAAIAREARTPCAVIGTVGGDRLEISGSEKLIDQPVGILEEPWRNCLSRQLDRG
jgi:phosphoribosylformylglycinamidine synthase